jgi:hypothetical protein
MIQNYLAPLSIGIIIVFFVLLRKHPKHKYILPTILSSLGILGTFIGIAFGLYSFDVNNLDQSVPTLLEGLKLAFVSSIAGIILTIIKKFELSNEETIEDEEDSSNSSSENLVPILKEMMAQNDYGGKLDELNLKLSGANDKSLAMLLGEILNGLNEIKLNSDTQNKNDPQNLESQIKELLDSNKSNNDDLKSFIKQLSNSMGIETDAVDNQKQIVSLLQELITKDEYGSKLDDLNAKLSGQENQSMATLLEKISEGIKTIQFQTEQFQENQSKSMDKKFKQFMSIIAENNDELKQSLDKLSVAVGQTTKEVLPGIEQNMSQFSQDLGQTMVEATEKMSKSFDKKSVEADEAGKWQVRSVIELQELNNSIKKLIKKSDNQTQQFSDNNKKLIFTLKQILENNSTDDHKEEKLKVV